MSALSPTLFDKDELEKFRRGVDSDTELEKFHTLEDMHDELESLEGNNIIT
ncbi:hypothetical protein [Halococcus sp. PRR34]|uniref:hypothetical protein n=1 Tax=Halococcus sp. PRR34 TaxID=3020830 RepID=UPI00236316E2|nr:hypothetical protein [Halococcus sp. PRR34]